MLGPVLVGNAGSHKERLRAMIRARSGGASSADTIKAGDEAEAACLRRLAEDEARERLAAARFSTAPVALASEQSASQPPMPNLRRL
jgi:DNA-binding TFAR19-related protein (PDSD5 family)